MAKDGIAGPSYKEKLVFRDSFPVSYHLCERVRKEKRRGEEGERVSRNISSAFLTCHTCTGISQVVEASVPLG